MNIDTFVIVWICGTFGIGLGTCVLFILDWLFDWPATIYELPRDKKRR